MHRFCVTGGKGTCADAWSQEVFHSAIWNLLEMKASVIRKQVICLKERGGCSSRADEVSSVAIRNQNSLIWWGVMCSMRPCFQDWCDAPLLNNTTFQARPSKINGPFPARGCLRGAARDWFCWIRNDSFCMSPWCCDLWNIIIYTGERLNSPI